MSHAHARVTLSCSRAKARRDCSLCGGVVCAALVLTCFLASADEETRTGKGVLLDVVHKLLVRVYCPMTVNVILRVFRGCTFRARLRHPIVSGACVFPSMPLTAVDDDRLWLACRRTHQRRACGELLWRPTSAPKHIWFAFIALHIPSLGTGLHSSWRD